MKKLIAIILLTAVSSVTYGVVPATRICLDVWEYSQDADVHIYDTEYDSMGLETLKEIKVDHKAMGRKYAPGFSFKSRKFDCDDHAFTFKTIVSYYGLMMGKNFQCGVIMVKQVKAFGGVPAGGLHALNIILIDGELWVLEPQTYKVTPLVKYPNRSKITGLIL